MTVKEKLREWAGMKELYNKPEKPRIVTGYSCAADLPEKLERLLRRTVDATYREQYPQGSYRAFVDRAILRALEEKDDE